MNNKKAFHVYLVMCWVSKTHHGETRILGIYSAQEDAWTHRAKLVNSDNSTNYSVIKQTVRGCKLVPFRHGPCNYVKVDRL